MKAAAADLNFEMAAELRDQMIELKKNLEELQNMLHTAEQRRMFELFYQYEHERTR